MLDSAQAQARPLTDDAQTTAYILGQFLRELRDQEVPDVVAEAMVMEASRHLITGMGSLRVRGA